MESKFDDNFFSKRKHIAWRAQVVCDNIINLFKPKSVIDVGCSIGEFLKEFKQRGIMINGIENTKAVLPHLMISEDDLILWDITNGAFIPPERYDLAMCFMVVGRLPEDKWDTIAESLVALSDTIITVVENEPLWSECMKKQGYEEDKLSADIFRNSLGDLLKQQAVKSFGSTQVFRKKIETIRKPMKSRKYKFTEETNVPVA